MMSRMGAISTKYDDDDLLCDYVASLIAEGKVIGWFQGRMEFGPRALGNRSILGDPRNEEMQKTLNLKIKYREGFRPFAPSVLAEDVQDFFECDEPSPYMLFVAPFLMEKRYKLPDNYYSMNIMERLYIKRSDLQCITHADFSCRIQTVTKNTNEKYWKLLNAFKSKTGIGVLVNTSFNVRGEPIVCTPIDAYKCFMNTEMDILVIENHVFQKNQQPDYDNKQRWNIKFKTD
jgi:carbamoyltransferase